MYHSFDPDIAKEYGVNEAIILQRIAFWVDTNEKNERNFIDGRYWTYNSAKAFKNQFPYMSVRTIQRVLKHLIDEGLILSGKFNNDSRNRTNYYALTDYGESLTTNWRVALRQKGNTDYDKTAECLFNKNTDSSTDINSLSINTLCEPVISAESAKISEMFEAFWKAYPKKVKKQNALREFKKIKGIEELMPTILADLEIKRQSKDWTKENGQYIPDPERYIKNERWNDVNEVAEKQIAFNEAIGDEINKFLF